MKRNITIAEAFTRAGIDMQAGTYVEVLEQSNEGSWKGITGTLVLNRIEEAFKRSDYCDVRFEFRDTIKPWWDEKEYAGREAVLTVNWGDYADYYSFAIIQ